MEFGVVDVHQVIAKLADYVVVETMTIEHILQRRGIGAVFRVHGQRRVIDGGALYAWMVEERNGGATLSQRLLATLRGGFG